MMRLLPGRGRQAELDVDSSRVALWGSSFAGGHVLVMAAELADDWRIRAVVSQARASAAWGGAGRVPSTLVGSCMVLRAQGRTPNPAGIGCGARNSMRHFLFGVQSLHVCIWHGVQAMSVFTRRCPT